MSLALEHGSLIDAIVRLLHDRYVDADVAAQLAERLRALLPDYRGIADPDELARRLTADLRDARGDRHFRVDHRPAETARLRAAPVEDRVSDAWLPRLAAQKPRFVDALVFVLTSQKTFSAAEEFAYDLKAMGRGIVVGETTAGAANFGERVAVDERFTMFLPVGRPINPITGGNWEGTGVTPHVAVAAADALDVAQQLALEALIERTDGDAERGRLRAELAALRPVSQ